MTSPEASAVTAVEALLTEARRLGMLPRYRYGTVQASSGTNAAILLVTLDGDTQASRIFNVAGPMIAGDRVFTVEVKPHGVYGIGKVQTSIAPVVETLEGSGDWTPPTGALFAQVELQAAGGGGGGAGTTGAGQWAFGDGGGGGEYASGFFAIADLPSSVAYSVGTGGAGGSGAVAGTDGNNTTFDGSNFTALGGNGGAIRSATSTARFSTDTSANGGGSGGVGGDFRIPGSAGGVGIGIDSVATGVRGGAGGDSHLGAGSIINNPNGGGASGVAFGGGGGGASNAASQAATRTGGTGAAGTIIITSFFR